MKTFTMTLGEFTFDELYDEFGDDKIGRSFSIFLLGFILLN